LDKSNQIIAAVHVKEWLILEKSRYRDN